MKRTVPAALLALSLASCVSVDNSAFERYRKESGLELSQGDAPAGVQSLGLVWAQRSGLYIFALVPIVHADLESTLGNLVAEARRIGADGIAHVRIEYDPARFFAFESWPFPWVQTLSLSGMAYKK